jgi:fatty-acyl-CoA synthase
MSSPDSRTIPGLLLELAHRTPNAPAVISHDEQLDYATVVARAGSVADYLQRVGTKSGDRVGLLCDNRAEWLAIFVGISALGATVVPFSTWSTTSELDFLVADSRVSLVFTLERIGGRLFAQDFVNLAASGQHAALKRIVAIDATGKDGATARASVDAYDDVVDPNPRAQSLRTHAANPEDILAVLYTSGSSNRPKAVPLLHGDAIINGFNIGERQGLATTDRVLIAIPLFWSYGAINALPATLSHGAAMVLQDRFEPGGALDLIEQHRCTALYTLPAMTNALLSHPSFRRERTASLRTGVTIGAPQDVVRAATELGVSDICNIYGSTETYGNCAVSPHEWPLEQRAKCQGLPLPGVTIRIRNGETGEIASSGLIGEIEVKGYITPGYDGLSATHNQATFTEDGFFRTGDLGSVGSDGALTYAGRHSEMIKRSGINVSPAEVEETLQRHPGIGLAGVTGVDDEARGEVIVAYVTLKSGKTFDELSLLEHCREQLSRYKIPDHLIVCDSMPLTVTGKLMRRELKTMAIEHLNSQRAIADSNL